MTAKEITAKLERTPFTPVYIHLTGGKSHKVTYRNALFLMRHSLMVLRGVKPGKATIVGYDVIALRNIERIESMPERPHKSSR